MTYKGSAATETMLTKGFFFAPTNTYSVFNNTLLRLSFNCNPGTTIRAKNMVHFYPLTWLKSPGIGICQYFFINGYHIY